MKTIILTGSTGFIGKHLKQKMISEGVQVYSADTLNSTEGLPHDADAFYHFAWQGMSPPFRNDFEMQYWNIAFTLKAVRIAAELGTKEFILPGSTNEYLYHYAPVNETAVPSPTNSYGAVKLAARFLCNSLASQLGIGFIYTVITGVYASDRRDGNVIFYTIEELLNGRKPILTSLEQKWDYVHIDDVCEALYLIGKKGKSGKFYSIGHGDNIPLYEYIVKIRDIIDTDLPLGIGEKSSTEKITSSCIDLTELKKDTGFVPKVPFDIGIRAVIEEVRNNL